MKTVFLSALVFLGMFEQARACDMIPGLSPAALASAQDFLARNSARIPNRDFMAVIDFSKHSSVPRFFLVDLRTGTMTSTQVAHGIGSDDGRGCAIRFSNMPMSRASSLGAYITLSPYAGKHGPSIRLEGLEAGNSSARERGMIIHGTSYVGGAVIGRSWGSFALSPAANAEALVKLAGGALIYAWSPGAQ